MLSEVLDLMMARVETTRCNVPCWVGLLESCRALVAFCSRSLVSITITELIVQLDGFDSRGAIKVLMATNRPDTLDPALLRPGRLDRKIEFGLPDLEGREQILRIHAKTMSVAPNIRFGLIARLCTNATGAELKSVSTEAGLFAIRARRRICEEGDYLKAVEKVINQGKKFSSTSLYSTYSESLWFL